MAARISSGSAALLSCAARAVPWKLPRTLFGMPMLASASLMSAAASDRLEPGARLKAMVVASSPSWWLIAVAAELSAKRAMAVSGTMVVALVLKAEPVDASLTAGAATLAGVAVTAVPAALPVPWLPALVEVSVNATGTPFGLPALGAGRPLDGTCRSRSASGLSE